MKVPELENLSPVRYNKPWTDTEEDVIKEYYPLPKALPIKAIADHLGRTPVSVMRKVAHMGVKRVS